jgi:taurine dioxygenase
MTAQFTTLPLGESDALLEELFAVLYDPAHIYDHHWRAGDLVIWDNLAVQHARAAFGTAPRTLQRVSITQYGYWEQVPTDLPVFRAMQEM